MAMPDQALVDENGRRNCPNCRQGR